MVEALQRDPELAVIMEIVVAVSCRLRMHCAVFVEIIHENEGAHGAITECTVQKIGKTINKTIDRQSRTVRLFILPSSVAT
jgi:hypothetical protein